MRFMAIRGIVAALLVACAASASAQSLAEIARREEARRKAMPVPGKVYTNEALQPEPPPSPGSVPAGAPPAAASDAPAAPGAEAAKPADPAAPGAAASEAEWKKRLADARDALSRAQTFAEAIQTRINVLSADFVNTDDPAKRDVVAVERTKALAELDRLKQEIQTRQKAITGIQEEARRAGVPPGWVR
jgi:hypothetical protein